LGGTFKLINHCVFQDLGLRNLYGNFREDVPPACQVVKNQVWLRKGIIKLKLLKQWG
jgi:hypothetical protein